MASQSEVTESSSAFERLVINRDLSLILPIFSGFAHPIQGTDPQGPERGNESRRTPLNRIIFVNTFTRQLMLIEGTSSFDSLFCELGRKDGQSPASKPSIEAMPRVDISENVECVICLEEMEVGGVAKEMPCKHIFHATCIEKWLELNGSCPVCRYKMPVDEKDGSKKIDEKRQKGGLGGRFG